MEENNKVIKNMETGPKIEVLESGTEDLEFDFDPEVQEVVRSFNPETKNLIAKALGLVRENFENNKEEKNNLSFHNSEHTKGVIERTIKILLAYKKTNPDVTDHDFEVAAVAAACHDTVQKYISNVIREEKGDFKGQEKVMRKRLAGNGDVELEDGTITLGNEAASVNEALALIQKANESRVIFNDNDKVTVQKAISATFPDFNGKTVIQPNLKEDSSFIERALALADLGTAGIDGPEKYEKEGKDLFREENLDIVDAIKNGVENIPQDKKDYFRSRMVGWLKFQSIFAKGREELLEPETKDTPEVKKLFKNFKDSIENSQEVVKRAEKMNFEDLLDEMGYEIK